MCVPYLVPIGPQTATCIRLEGYTHRHTLSYIDIDQGYAVIVHHYLSACWFLWRSACHDLVSVRTQAGKKTGHSSGFA